MTWHSQPAGRILGELARGAVDASEVLASSLDRIREVDPVLNAFVHVEHEEAAVSAARSHEKRDRGEAGALEGLPIAVKDNLCVRGWPATCGSRILEHYRPPYDATVVERLRAAGAVIVGKTNLDEFAMGSSNENSAFGPVVNPWATDRVAGGSSGGSAAAVASGEVPLALGSDTGGSVRQPAAFCGVYGLKPSYGRVSRFGLVAFASSFDQVGCFSGDLDGLETLFNVISGADPRDSTSTTFPTHAPGSSDAPLRVGVADGLLDPAGVDPEISERVRACAGLFEASGAVVDPVELPDPELAVALYYVLTTAEASSNLARYDGVRYGHRHHAPDLQTMYRTTRSRGFGREVQRRILLGTYVLSAGYYDAYYETAQRGRRRLAAAFDAVHQSVDVVLLPTTPSPAFLLGEKLTDPVSMYLADVFTVYANLTGCPALSVPVGFTGAGLPIGVQLLAGPGREDRLFAAARAIEAAGRWPVTLAEPGSGSKPTAMPGGEDR